MLQFRQVDQMVDVLQMLMAMAFVMQMTNALDLMTPLTPMEMVFLMVVKVHVQNILLILLIIHLRTPVVALVLRHYHSQPTVRMFLSQ